MVKYRNPAHTMVDEPIIDDEEIPVTSVEEANWKKRYGDLRRKEEEVRQQAKRDREDLERKLQQAMQGKIRAPSSEEEVEQWMSEYPDFAGILDTIVEKKVSSKTSDTNLKMKEIEEKQRELEVEKAIVAIKKLHPDFDQLVKDSKFHDWLSKQKKADQEAIYSGLDVDDADFVISKYKSSRNRTPSNEDNSYKDAAKPVKTGFIGEDFTGDFGEYLFTESQIDRESRRNKRWFEQNEEAIMKAAREGKILMDVSGK
jgi:hypothetical protein